MFTSTTSFLAIALLALTLGRGGTAAYRRVSVTFAPVADTGISTRIPSAAVRPTLNLRPLSE
jgi:hypothetical protein